MNKITTKVYGIKNCDTVKKALKYLIRFNVAYEFIDFRLSPISRNEYQGMIDSIGFEALINKRSSTYRLLSENEKNNINYDLISKYPTLIKRPVITHNGKMIVGYSENKYSDFFS